MKRAFYIIAAIGMIIIVGLLINLLIGVAVWTWLLIFLFILVIITLYCLRRTGVIKQHESVIDALRRFAVYLKEP